MDNKRLILNHSIRKTQYKTIKGPLDFLYLCRTNMVVLLVESFRLETYPP